MATAHEGHVAAERYVASLERIAERFAAYANRCDPLAHAIGDATSARDELAVYKTSAAYEFAATDSVLSRRLDAATQSIADGSMACATNPAFAAARAKLFPAAQRTK